MIKKLLNIFALLGICLFLYSQNEYSSFILGNSQFETINKNSVSVSNLIIEDGKYFLNVSNGYQVKRVPVELTSEIQDGFVEIDYKLSKNERILTK
ncbi:hypothetical protein CL656_00700 [bacterium]|nr:hypothetical protein [bacterium]|tara:strand:- start:2864 stop:3151 length:288 start_codon:yes stop_codon:yes gene_type:complete